MYTQFVSIAVLTTPLWLFQDTAGCIYACISLGHVPSSGVTHHKVWACTSLVDNGT